MDRSASTSKGEAASSTSSANAMHVPTTEAPFGISIADLHALEFGTTQPNYHQLSEAMRREIVTKPYPRWTKYEYTAVHGKVADKIKEGEALYAPIERATERSFAELAAITIDRNVLKDFQLRRTTLHNEQQISATQLLPPKTQTKG
jgi:hypothetical protein